VIASAVDLPVSHYVHLADIDITLTAKKRKLWRFAEQNSSSSAIGNEDDEKVMKQQQQQQFELAREQCRQEHHRRQFLLLRGHVLAGRYAAARDVWLISGFQPRATVEYNLLLQALFKVGAKNHCMALFAEMKQQRFEPDVVTYTTVMQFHVRKSVARLSSELQNKRRHADEIAFYKLHAEMRVNGVALDSVFYDMLLEMYANASACLQGNPNDSLNGRQYVCPFFSSLSFSSFFFFFPLCIICIVFCLSSLLLTLRVL
jgi:pentatricopeptide repeat protein